MLQHLILLFIYRLLLHLDPLRQTSCYLFNRFLDCQTFLIFILFILIYVSSFQAYTFETSNCSWFYDSLIFNNYRILYNHSLINSISRLMWLISVDRVFSAVRWSFGVLLWEIFSLADVPYESVPVENLLSSLKNGSRLEKPNLATTDV